MAEDYHLFKQGNNEIVVHVVKHNFVTSLTSLRALQQPAKEDPDSIVTDSSNGALFPLFAAGPNIACQERKYPACR
jgi:hypothetical protein